MNAYQRTHNHFFFSCAYLRHAHGLNTLTLEQIEYGKWLSIDDIKDFTIAYMMGNEL